ncbi:MAG: hypothetical protein ACREQE_11905, partial [Candidatus Binataceae bacterium]
MVATLAKPQPERLREAKRSRTSLAKEASESARRIRNDDAATTLDGELKAKCAAKVIMPQGGDFRHDTAETWL